MSQAGQFYISSFIATLTGDTGGAITPVAGNIDILGGPGVSVDGTAGTLTITVGGAASSFPTDVGTATPVAGVLNIYGGTNLNTTGAGNTVTVIMDDNITLAGQLEADSVESITYITAGTNITATTGNITSVAGDIISGDAITAVGDITSTTGDLNTVTGDVDCGGAVNSVGNITSSTGDVIAQVDVQAVTGDIVSSAGAGNFATTVTAGTGITSTTGPIAAAAGNITASGTITAGTGLIATTGGVLASDGNITATLGNILTSTGSIDSAATISAVGTITSSTGNIVTTVGDINSGADVNATVDVTAGGVITSVGNITSSTGNVVTTVGSIDSGSTISAVGDITTSAGDLVATTGDIRAPLGTLYVGTFSATGDIVTSGGDLIATVGDVQAGNKVIAGNGVTVTSGGILVSAGDVLAATGNLTAQMNIVAITGNINAELGDITAGFDIVAGADVSSIMGDVTAEQGDVLARYDVEALEGDILAHQGDIRTIVGFIRSAGAVIADANLKATGTVQFPSIVNGGLVADADGYVTASLATATATGFATWIGAGAYYDDSVLGSFEVLRGGTGYIKGILVSWAGAQTVTGMTAGDTYLIYMDDTGTIGKTTTFSQATFNDYIVLFECLRDSTVAPNVQYTVKENHPYDFQPAVSWWAHETIGTIIENHNQGANITLNGTQKIEIVGADELSDHGLCTDIPDGGGVAEDWNMMLTNGAGKWITYQTFDVFDGYWNSAGTATAPSGTKWSIYTLYVCKDDITAATPTYWAVLDDQEYNNLAAAQLAVSNGTPARATTELAKLEFAQLGYIIYRQSIDTIVDVIISKSTVGSGTTGGGGTNQASLVLTTVTNFDGILSATDTTVQVALDTIDDWGAATTDHAVLLGQGVGTPIASTTAGTNGQVVVGSTGADPDFANITSTDSSLTITEGAGTLVIEGTDATETQDGVVELATDAEAIAGTDTVRAIVPTSLKAKLGAQTDHGVLVGSGTTAAITALAVGTNGQLLVGSTGADPVFATVASADASIEITGGAGTIDLSASGILTIVAETGTTYEFLLTDVGKLVTCTNAAAITVTIPVNADVAIPIGSQILVTQLGAGVVTLAPEGGVTLNSRGSLLDTNGQYATVACVKRAVNSWIISGDVA